MKNLNDFINNQYISFEGLDEEDIENISNLKGQVIHECCDCCKCCEPCCGTCIGEDPFANDQAFKMYFYSEREIVEKLKTVVTVQDLFNLHSQFSYNRFALRSNENKCPLIFTEKLMLPSGELMQGRSYINNIKLLDIIQKSELSEVVILVRLDNSIQVFGLKYTGTNGKEGSIKNSLIDVSKKLTELERINEINWAQVLDVSIDNADDVYTFLITFTCNGNDIPDNPQEKEAVVPIAINK